MALLAISTCGCAASISGTAPAPVYRASLDAPQDQRAMPPGCRLIATTAAVSMTELEMDGQKDPFRVQRRQASQAGANVLLVLSRVTVPRRDPNCPPSSRITDCAPSSGAWFQVGFESYSCTPEALRLLPAPSKKPAQGTTAWFDGFVMLGEVFYTSSPPVTTAGRSVPPVETP